MCEEITLRAPAEDKADFREVTDLFLTFDACIGSGSLGSCKDNGGARRLLSCNIQSNRCFCRQRFRRERTKKQRQKQPGKVY